MGGWECHNEVDERQAGEVRLAEEKEISAFLKFITGPQGGMDNWWSRSHLRPAVTIENQRGHRFDQAMTLRLNYTLIAC